MWSFTRMLKYAAIAVCLLASIEAAITGAYNQKQQAQFGTSTYNTGAGITATSQSLNLSDNSRKQQDGYIDKQYRDRYNYRYPDGSYEFRYELVDGTARYERGYFLLIDKVKTLVVTGYYSYRMPDGRYLTVFYNADQFGYRQNQAITPQVNSNLPRSIEVPEYKEHNTATRP